MSQPNLGQVSKPFNLPADATLLELDERYRMYIMRAVKKQKTDPAYANSRKEELDEAYAVLLRSFISNKCTMSLSYGPRRNHTIFELPLRAQDGIFQQVLDRDRTEQRSFNGQPGEQDILAGSRINGGNTTASHIETFQLFEASGNIFALPDGDVIVHAVNCMGAWGAGFAAELRQRFPRAFAVYRHYCSMAVSPESLAGTSLLIPPQAGDAHHDGRFYPQRWLACLFTSVGYGQRLSSSVNPGRGDVESILKYTDAALMDLRHGLVNARRDARNTGASIGNLCSPKINSGLFGVPWEDTKQLIEKKFASYRGTWTVLALPRAVDA